MNQEGQEAAGGQPAAPGFTAVLRPHRSLPPGGFVLLMALVGLVSFAAGLVFLLIGAWPVVGFLGLDVALIYGAFRANYRAGEAQEKITLSEGLLRVERRARRGRAQGFELNPYWVRVVLEEAADGSNELVLLSHGRRFAIAACLGAREKARFADVLRQALARHQG